VRSNENLVNLHDLQENVHLESRSDFQIGSVPRHIHGSMLNAPVPGLFLCVDMDGVDIERSGIAAFSAPPFVRTVYCVTEIVILPWIQPSRPCHGYQASRIEEDVDALCSALSEHHA
jgi:hypothetical protein